MTGLPTSPPNQSFVGRVYRRRLSASVIAPAATRTMTMTVASASTEARVSYQLFQSSSMRWPLSSARPPAIKYTLSKGRAFAHKNTMLRFVACVLIARQHDLCRTPAYRANVDYGRRAVRSPAAMSKMLANCEVVYIPVFLARANVAKASYFEGGIQCSRQSNGTPDITLANGW